LTRAVPDGWRLDPGSAGCAYATSTSTAAASSPCAAFTANLGVDRRDLSLGLRPDRAGRSTGKQPGARNPRHGTDGSSSVIVTYVASGDARQADVTYQNRNGDTSAEVGVSLPWESSFATTPKGRSHTSRPSEVGHPGTSRARSTLTVRWPKRTQAMPYTICTASGSV
jgi:hypothetical protein